MTLDRRGWSDGPSGEFSLSGKDEAELAALYRELRIIARAMRRRKPSETLNTTAVVHEAWLRYLGEKAEWKDRKHFLASAAVVMRRLVVDYARRHDADKRSPGERLPLMETATGSRRTIEEVLGIDEALGRLERLEPRLARVVELRVFVGLSVSEVADSLDLSARSVSRDWDKARAFLRMQLEE